MALAIALAVVATVLQNIAYLREHDAAVVLPALDVRHPLVSLRLLLGSHGWLSSPLSGWSAVWYLWSSKKGKRGYHQTMWLLYYG